MYEVDFLAVENEKRDGTKSGDAIATRFTAPDGTQKVVVIDAGFTDVGEQLVTHIRDYYDVEHIDLVISTHPDTDHLNGLQAVLDSFSVGELMLHLPWNHVADATALGNYDRIVELAKTALRNNVTLTEPFAGADRFDGGLRILGPTKDFYEANLSEALDEAFTARTSSFGYLAGSAVLTLAQKALEKKVDDYPDETLTDVDDTGARNQASVVTYVDADGHRMLFTGDAGIAALDAAATEYERVVGPLSAYPLQFFQAPHHGSKHNLGPTILDRWIGGPADGSRHLTAFISSARLSEKHPSPKVTNALGRRGAIVFATEGSKICHLSSTRDGWTKAPELPPLVEDDD